MCMHLCIYMYMYIYIHVYEYRLYALDDIVLCYSLLSCSINFKFGISRKIPTSNHHATKFHHSTKETAKYTLFGILLG